MRHLTLLLALNLSLSAVLLVVGFFGVGSLSRAAHTAPPPNWLTSTPNHRLDDELDRSPAVTATPTACLVTFADVPPSNPFYPYVRCLSCRGIVSGYPCGGPGEPCPGLYFRPAARVTRGQTSKIVSQTAGFTESVPSTQQTFADVPPVSTFWLDVERLASRGIIAGYPCGGSGEPCIPPANRPYFRLNNPVTRGQLSKIVSTSAGYAETPTGQTFQDVPPGSTFYLYVERIAARGTISGYPCGGAGEPCVAPTNRPYFRPAETTTRGQISKIVANTFFPNCDQPGPTPTAPPLPTHTPAATPTPSPGLTPNPACFAQVPSPNPGAVGNSFSAVAAAGAANLCAVGETDPSGDTLIAHWDGSAWTQVAGPSPGQRNQLYGVYAVSAKEAWAVGNADTSALILHWLGGSWTAVPSPHAGILRAIHGTSAADLWAVGETNVAPTAQALVLHWNGSAWSQVTVPTLGNKSSLYGVSALTPGNAWAVGTASAGSNFTTVLLHWDGSAWSHVPSPVPGNVGTLHAVAARDANDVWVVGTTGDQTLTLHWDGLVWTQVSSPNPGSNGNVLYGVSGTHADDLWAVGEMDTASGPQTLVLHWDGTAWRWVSSPNPSSTVNVLYGVTALNSTDIWLAGYYAVNTATQTLILHSCPPARSP